MKPVGVVPVDPVGDLPLDRGSVGPGGSAVVDGLGLEQPDGGLAQGVVQGVADGADRPGDPSLEEFSGERHGCELLEFMSTDIGTSLWAVS